MDNYNAIAMDYNEFEQNAITLWRLGYPAVMDLLGDVAGKSVLDYGCGTGIFSRFLQSKGAKVTGVDVSENMIRVAERNSAGSIRYHTINSGKMDFLDEYYFDFVVSNFVLCTLNSSSEMALILGQIYRVLKKNGAFVFMNSHWDKSNGKEFISFKLEFCRELMPGNPITAIIKSEPPIRLHDYFWPVAVYRRMLAESGFRIQDQVENIASGDDVPWLDEKKFPPYYAISAIK